MAKAKRTKRRSRTGWGRFVQDNALTAASKAKADGGEASYFAVLSEWWKEVSAEIKDSYNKDKDFVHKVNSTAEETPKSATEESNEPKESAEPEAAPEAVPEPEAEAEPAAEEEKPKEE